MSGGSRVPSPGALINHFLHLLDLLVLIIGRRAGRDLGLGKLRADLQRLHDPIDSVRDALV
jgi:hypothetical protein